MKEEKKSNNNLFSINILDVQVTERCTMKCIDCSNLMQYYEKPINSDQFILESSLEKILSAVDKINELRILGGEPFLYKNLSNLLDIIKNYNNIDKIIIYTNATFVPNNEIIKSIMNDKRILVEITNYLEYSKAKDKLIDVFKELKIDFISHLPQNWTDSARIINTNRKADELTDLFEKCCVNDILTLLHGKIYHCPFSANAHNLKAIPTSDSDYILIEKNISVHELKNKLKKYYFGRKFLTACKYCLGRDYTQVQVVPAIQTKKSINIPVIQAS
jgi:MoaA/NifB/PqqE/SkfB family radical SAM enzyme